MTKGPLQKINYIKRSEPFWILIRPNFTFAPRYRRPWVVSGFRNRCRTQTVPNERATTGGHTARAPDPQITKTPNWALGSCSPQIWGLWRSWQAWRYMEGYFGERERLWKVRKGYEVCPWGQLRQLPRTVSAKTRDSQCLQTDRLRQPALQSTEFFWKNCENYL